MNFLIKFSLKNVAAIFIITFLIILGGLYSFSNLKMEMLPDIESPVLTIEAIYPGASPDDVNENVTMKLEEQVKNIQGVETIESSSFENVGIVSLTFPYDTDLDKMEQEVAKAIDQAQLSEDVQTDILRFSLSMIPVYDISVFAKGDTDLTTYMEEEVVPALKKVKGVQNVAVAGEEHHLVQITVDKEKALQSGLTLSSIQQQINAKYLSFPAGQVQADDLEISVRVEEKLETIEELENLQLLPPGINQLNATPVFLKDIANVEEVTKQTELTRYNLKDAISLVVTKKQDANTVEVADEVTSVLNEYEDKMNYYIGFDSASTVKDSVHTLVREGLLGAVFASLAVLLFLRNIRATIIAVISIPFSLIFASIFLNQLDISLNMMTLGGMAVAVGRVVDDSIVVIENIFRRARRAGEEKISSELIIDSTKEIIKAIVSSTLTTIVVFLPLGFVEGETGGFFMPFALTITFALIASLLVSVTLVPILAKYSFKRVPKEEKEGFLQRKYAKLIERSLNHKVVTIVIACLLLAGSIMLVPRLGFTFLPNEEQKILTASIELPAATTMARTNEVSLEIEELFNEQNEIKDITAAVGSRDMFTGLKLENKANYFLTLEDGVQVDEFVKGLRKDMEAVMGEEAEEGQFTVQELAMGGPPTNNNIMIDLYSNDLDELQKAAKKVEAYLKKNEDLKNVTNNFTDKQRQYLVEIDSSKSSEFGVAGMQVLGTISDQTRPVEVGELTLNEDVKTVQLSYDEELTANDLQELTVFSQKGPVNLEEIADVKEIESFTSIQKLDGKVFARISAQVKGNDIQAVTDQVTAGVKNDIKLPEGVSFESGGGSEETTEQFQQMGIAMIAAIGLVYLTMLITFGKARIPIIILSSLVFVPIGSFTALFLAKEPLSISVMIGFLMLIGIVVTNAIVLTDRITRNQEEKGLTIREALIEAGKTRLRPILMTALATIAALLPLAFTTSSGTIISKGLALTVIGGLASSTLLTLILIPILYELFFFRRSKKERINKTTEITH
ncbi:efflux RND transporter permease subunit [Alkalihalobacillus sp. AL-G]|uniref:efflux RND transporter permease subunit n=1 Tax=Alkalihalobacillus sp. AL-G TaxID=2926399 RepID=UPI00272A0C5E|nr:efflux RND transporter permease subunit [Alkalihalobacillus sp. AL-G]WLD93597.1 efflux RND transporter permease subunit [Alkalihalobacillus sp. AL-G]